MNSLDMDSTQIELNLFEGDSMLLRTISRIQCKNINNTKTMIIQKLYVL